MKKHVNGSKQISHQSHLSEATMQVARNNLKELESQSKRAFFIRADMDRKLSSL